MTTDQLLSMQPAVAGLNLATASAGAPAVATGEGSEDFLKALLQKIKGLSPGAAAAPGTVPVRQDGTATPLAGDDFAAFIEQIKVLAGQSALTTVSRSGKEGDGDGNLLPGQAAADPELLPLTPEQLEQLVSQLLGRTPDAAQAPETEAGGAAVPQASSQLLLAATDANPVPASSPLQPNPADAGEASGGKAEAPSTDAAMPFLPNPPVAADTAAASTGSAQPQAPVATRSPAEGVQAAVASAPPAAADTEGSSDVQMPVAAADTAAAPVVLAAPAPDLPASVAQGADLEAGGSATAIASALNGGGQGQNGKAGASSTSAVTSAMGEMALTPDLLKLVAAKTAKTGEGETEALASSFVSSHQDTRLGAAAVDRPDLGMVSQALAPDLRPAAHAQQTGVAAMSTPFGRPGWSEDFGERVVWMTGKGIQSAELQLNPQHLGPVEVRINLNQDQASVQFVAHHAAVREAIEAAIPKLREMLGAQQLNLADVSVAQQSFSDQRDYRGTAQAYDQPPQSSGQGGYPSGGSAEEPGFREGEAVISRQSGRGLLNLYA